VRSRRTVSRLPRLFRYLVAAAIAVVALVLGDRCAALYAEDKAAEEIQKSLKLEAAPQVRIHGAPFLTQVLGKRLGQVDVTIPDVPAGRVSIAKVEGSVYDVRVVGDLPSSIRGAVVGQMDGRVVLAFDDLDRELGSSQVKFTDNGRSSVLAEGKLPMKVAGHEVRARAEAHVMREGNRVTTRIDGMRLDVSGVGTYTPGPDGGLALTPQAAERVSRDAHQVRALLSVPSVAKHLGVGASQLERANRDRAELQRVTRSREFTERLSTDDRVAGAVADSPQALHAIGVGQELMDSLKHLDIPELSDQLSFSAEVPDLPGNARLQDVEVTKEGVEVEVSGTGLPIGKTH
jgi:LmeA-like phospholipid-binding